MACKRSGVQIPSAPHKTMKKFLSETKDLIMSQGIIAILAIIQIRVVATNLGPEAYGVIGVYLGIIGLCFRFFNSRNSDLVLINFKNKEHNFVKSSLFFEFILGCTSSLISLFFLFLSVYFNLLELPNLPIYLFIFIFSRIFTNFMEVFKGFYTHKGDLKKYSYAEAVSNILRFTFILLFILYNPTIENFFYAISLHSLLMGLYVFIVLSKQIEYKSKDMGLVEYLKLSKSNFIKIRIDQAVGLIPIHLDVVIIGIFTDFYSAGVYRIARKLVEPVNYIIVAFSPWMLNKIFQDGKYNFRTLTSTILVPIALVLIIFYSFLGENLIHLIAGPDFIESYLPLLTLLIGYLVYLLTFWTRHYLFLNELITKHTIGRIINLVIFTFFSVLLISQYSSIGIALSVTLGICAQKIYEFYVYTQNK